MKGNSYDESDCKNVKYLREKTKQSFNTYLIYSNDILFKETGWSTDLKSSYLPLNFKYGYKLVFSKGKHSIANILDFRFKYFFSFYRAVWESL